MESYWVMVRNEVTGEIATVCKHADIPAAAQVAALCQMFREQGWRRCTALIPSLVTAQMAAGDE